MKIEKGNRVFGVEAAGQRINWLVVSEGPLKADGTLVKTAAGWVIKLENCTIMNNGAVLGGLSVNDAQRAEICSLFEWQRQQSYKTAEARNPRRSFQADYAAASEYDADFLKK